jgi:DNA invertase Pin-like site-specific DNA recombinase
MARVSTIPARQNCSALAQNLARKKNVAAYARVSIDQREQEISYAAQVKFYTNHICSNPEWNFIKIYADDAATGTSTLKRNGFNDMINDALEGKIDLILTKSVSRFARNTVDSLTTVRRLKEKGVEIYFEKENIYTLDSKGELLITIMSSIAQEESRSISENIRWGIKRQMQNGGINMAYKRFLGYEKGEDGLPAVVEEQAAIVRRIYDLFLSGISPWTIANILTNEGIPTPGGKVKWLGSVIESILTNEKYAGNQLRQKTVTVDFLTKKRVQNDGIADQYFWEGTHPAIVDSDKFDLVQAEMQKRHSSDNRKKMSKNSAPYFSNKIFCGECNCKMTPVIWHSTSKYRREMWRCADKYKASDKNERCKTPAMRDDSLKWAFVIAFNRVKGEQLLSEFDAELFTTVCEKIVVYSDSLIGVEFRDGAVIDVDLDK